MTTMRKTAIAGILAVAGIIGVTGCTDVLVEPKSTVTGANIFDDPDSYRAYLAKLYAGLAVTGQQGPAGNSDIEGIDEGFGQYIRGYWQLQELPTEEAVIGWGDAGLPEVVTMQWASANQFLTAMYYRIYYQIALANEFLRETTDAKLTERGVSDDLRDDVQQFRAEARWLRALSYWHAIDFFGDVPLVDEDFVIGSTPPEQAERIDIFNFIVDELNAIQAELPDVGTAEYGRVDQGGAAMLLAKLYLNAEVYGAGNHYSEALAAAQTVIDGPYALDDNYQDLFLADNHTSPEMVFAVPYDGAFTQTWGGTTFLVAAAMVGNMDQSNYGTVEKWYGLRVTPEFVAKFDGGAGGPDSRSDILYTSGQSLAIADIGSDTDGYAYPKYRNVTTTGGTGAHGTFSDVDFPMFRLADAYLMYAEACLRSGGGACEGAALGYVNQLRQRAYGDNSGDITAGELTLAFILDERSRELAWEAHRRTDLIRYGLFVSSSYLWSWKGGSQGGQAPGDHRVLYPIPANEMISNPNLEQNPGY